MKKRSTAKVTRLSACHSERSEESLCGTEIPRALWAQRTLARNDKSELRATAFLGCPLKIELLRVTKTAVNSPLFLFDVALESRQWVDVLCGRLRA